MYNKLELQLLIFLQILILFLPCTCSTWPMDYFNQPQYETFTIICVLYNIYWSTAKECNRSNFRKNMSDI